MQVIILNEDKYTVKCSVLKDDFCQFTILTDPKNGALMTRIFMIKYDFYFFGQRKSY